jgi:site-specific recombinase XerD
MSATASAPPSSAAGIEAFRELWASFMRSLAGENRSPRTLRTYTEGAEQFLSWATDHGHTADPALIRREHIREFLGDLLTTHSPATARARFSALRRFFNWLVEEEEIDRSPMERMRGPVVPDKPTDIPRESEVRALLKVTEGKDFLERRDRAIVRLMIDCGLRRSEVANLRRDDLELDAQCIRVHGKGGHEDIVPFGTKATAELDRYMRVRGRHPHAKDGPLFVGMYGGITENAVYQMIERRCRQAGITMHPHQLRHYFADSWKSQGGSEEDLQRLGRWRDPKMLRRYGAAAGDRRARDAHRRFSPGDRL